MRPNNNILRTLMNSRNAKKKTFPKMYTFINIRLTLKKFKHKTLSKRRQKMRRLNEGHIA